MGLFYLLTLYCFIRGRRPIRIRRRRPGVLWFGLSWLACLLGMATKEVMVSAPLIVLLYDRTFLAGSFREAWRRRRGVHAGLARHLARSGFPGLFHPRPGRDRRIWQRRLLVELRADPVPGDRALPEAFGLAAPVGFRLWDAVGDGFRAVAALRGGSWPGWRQRRRGPCFARALRKIPGFRRGLVLRDSRPDEPGPRQSADGGRTSDVPGADSRDGAGGGRDLPAAGPRGPAVLPGPGRGAVRDHLQRNKEYRSALILWTDTVAKCPANPLRTTIWVPNWKDTGAVERRDRPVSRRRCA